MTHRQAMAYNNWLDAQWNVPTRADYYAMQIACEVRRVMSEKPREVLLGHMKLDFKPTAASKPMTPEQAAAASKSTWLSIFGPKIRGLPAPFEEMIAPLSTATTETPNGA